MRKPLLRIYNYIGRRYLSPILRAEQKKRPFPEINERAAEYAFALRYLKTFASGPVLDIGPGRSSWPHLLTICGLAVREIAKRATGRDTSTAISLSRKTTSETPGSPGRFSL